MYVHVRVCYAYIRMNVYMYLVHLMTALKGHFLLFFDTPAHPKTAILPERCAKNGIRRLILYDMLFDSPGSLVAAVAAVFAAVAATCTLKPRFGTVAGFCLWQLDKASICLRSTGCIWTLFGHILDHLWKPKTTILHGVLQKLALDKC